MRKVVFVILGVLVALFLLVEFAPGSGFMGSGAYSLSVKVVSEGYPPTRVSCQAHWDEPLAKWAAEKPELYSDIERVTTADPFDGTPLEVRVTTDMQWSLILGRTTRWCQSEWLVVLAEWPDGRRVAKVVPIPDGQTTQTLRVELP